jgi:hypothetical protein
MLESYEETPAYRRSRMNHNRLLVIMSLLSILLMTLHATDDTLRAKAGTAEAGGSTLVGVPLLVGWMYGTLILSERRSGHVVMLIGSLLAIGMPILHVNLGPAGVFSGQLAKSYVGYLFVWSLHAMAVTGLFSFILAVQGLWSLQREHRKRNIASKPLA